MGFLFRRYLDASLYLKCVSVSFYWEEVFTADSQSKCCITSVTQQPMRLADKNSNTSNL